MLWIGAYLKAMVDTWKEDDKCVQPLDETGHTKDQIDDSGAKMGETDRDDR